MDPDTAHVDPDTAHAEAVDRLEEQVALFHRRTRRFLRSFAGRVHPEMDASTYAVLLVIAQRPVRMIDLAEDFGLDKSTMSRHVSTLIALGLVQRDQDPMDGRAYLLRPTEDGQRRLAVAAAARREEWHGRLDAWRTDELTSLVTALAQLNADMDRP